MVFDLSKIPVDELINELPESLAQMVDVISVEALIKLVDSFGGQDLYIPAKLEPDSTISLVIGSGDAELLSKYYHGSDIAIPTLKRLREKYRNIEIRNLKSQGISSNKLASDFNLTKRQINNITKQR
jgi:Mor family transcriptional regulator